MSGKATIRLVNQRADEEQVMTALATGLLGEGGREDRRVDAMPEGCWRLWPMRVWGECGRCFRTLCAVRQGKE